MVSASVMKELIKEVFDFMHRLQTNEKTDFFLD